jgi:hypothetical protein
VRSKNTTIRVVRIAAFNPSTYTILGWEVPDIEAMTKQFSANGIEFERYPFLEQNADGIWSAPDGSILSISQRAQISA